MSSRSAQRGATIVPLIAGIPATVPFVGPETLERRSGRPLALRLGANESAFGPSPRARAAMVAAVDRVAHYSDPECYDLRTTLAARHNVGIEQVAIGSGIDDLLGLIVRACLGAGEVAVTSLGGYPTFTYHVTGFGGVLQRVPYRNDHSDLDGLVGAAKASGARLIYLANPDNPSGTWHSAAAIHALIDALPPHCTLVLDEAYADFAPADAVPTLDPADPRVLRLRTFSKAYGMAGARIGYAIATPEVIAAFDKIRNHFGVNRVAYEGALASLDDTAYLQTVIAEVARGRAEYVTLAHELGLPTLPSATNFVAIDVGSAARARALLAALATRDVFIRMPWGPPLDRCVRVTVGNETERAAFAAILRDVLPQLPLEPDA